MTRILAFLCALLLAVPANATTTPLSGAGKPACLTAAASATELLHMDGTNGGTSFPDSSANNFSLTVNAATTDTTASTVKFGSASGNFNGTSAYLQEPTSATLGPSTGNFTYELWVNWTSVPTTSPNVLNSSGGGSIGLDGSKHIGVFDGTFHTDNSIPTAGVWYDYSLVRVGSTMNFYINGTSVVSWTNSSTTEWNMSGAGSLIGSFATGSRWAPAHIDEVHILATTAQWTTNFTPPTLPWCG